ncbi:hypothetical protein GDO86_018081 [Hymenochirus boettgeri]|uniref:Uncharacterized protein n=1 Tax=Hymenochirus boettgeri TaxID=247094 RepID=A0A8T2IL85_9PIPI|nr:hypothetical protein GDO86_018081 [Hymenochirus boettgeri]
MHTRTRQYRRKKARPDDDRKINPRHYPPTAKEQARTDAPTARASPPTGGEGAARPDPPTAMARPDHDPPNARKPDQTHRPARTSRQYPLYAENRPRQRSPPDRKNARSRPTSTSEGEGTTPTHPDRKTSTEPYDTDLEKARHIPPSYSEEHNPADAKAQPEPDHRRKNSPDQPPPGRRKGSTTRDATEAARPSRPDPTTARTRRPAHRTRIGISTTATDRHRPGPTRPTDRKTARRPIDRKNSRNDPTGRVKRTDPDHRTALRASPDRDHRPQTQPDQTHADAQKRPEPGHTDRKNLPLTRPTGHRRPPDQDPTDARTPPYQTPLDARHPDKTSTSRENKARTDPPTGNGPARTRPTERKESPTRPTDREEASQGTDHR